MSRGMPKGTRHRPAAHRRSIKRGITPLGQPAPFAIARNTATNGCALLVAPDEGSRLFLRRAIKGVGGRNPRRVEWVVGELDGVRAYFDGTTVVLTTKDLRP